MRAISVIPSVDLSAKQALVLCLANPSRNPRPRRVVELLRSRGCAVDLLSYPSDGDLDVRRAHEIRTPSVAPVRRFARLAGKLVRNCMPSLAGKNLMNEWLLGVRGIDHWAGRDYDLLTVHDIALLPLALRMKGQRSKVLCDLREFYPLEFEHSRVFRFVEAGFKTLLCTELLHRCDALVSVSPGLVAEYKKRFDVDVALVRSTPVYRDVAPSVPARDVIRMVHHGNANQDRKLENMIKLFPHLDERFHLDLYLTGDGRYQSELRRAAAGCDRIQFREPVRFDRIIPVLSQYDIGLYLLEPTGFNTEHALPNKLFEFIQARLAVATGPSPDMAEVVTTYGCGIVSATFRPDDLARRLTELTPDRIMELKRNSDRAARELCFENEGKKLLKIIHDLLEPVATARAR